MEYFLTLDLLFSLKRQTRVPDDSMNSLQMYLHYFHFDQRILDFIRLEDQKYMFALLCFLII